MSDAVVTEKVSNLVSPAQLLHLLHRAEAGEGAAVRLLDVRWRLDRPEGRPEYLSGHVPGAVYVDLERELARRGQPSDGRLPLPDIEELQKAARSWGVNDGDIVIAYDDNHGVAAARAWWLLRRVGVRVRVLDGGLRVWRGEGLPLATGDVRASPGNVVLLGAAEGEISQDEVADFPAYGVLLDVRGPDQYSGTQASLDPIGGHIPGAVNLPAMAVLTADGRLQQPAALRRIFAAAGVVEGTAVAVYCGYGVASAHTVLALDQAGISALLYAGSWSQWANTRGRPVAVGILPSGRIVFA